MIYFSVVAFLFALVGLLLFFLGRGDKWQRVGFWLFQVGSFFFIYIATGAKIVRLL